MSPAAPATCVPVEGPGAFLPWGAASQHLQAGPWVPVETRSLDACAVHQAGRTSAQPSRPHPPSPVVTSGWGGIMPLCAAVQPGELPLASVDSLRNVLSEAQEPSLSDRPASGTGVVEARAPLLPSSVTRLVRGSLQASRMVFFREKPRKRNCPKEPDTFCQSTPQRGGARGL